MLLRAMVDILELEPWIRAAGFAGVLVLCAWWESALPRRARSRPRRKRWPSNLGIVVLNTLLIRLLFPVAAVGVAVIAHDRGWGMLNQAALPAPLAFVIGFVALDFVIYLQHVMVHAVPLLWRFHRMHHADVDFDVTTAGRFHPVEIALSMLWKMGVVLVLGPTAATVVAFEVVLNASSTFNHANGRLPSFVDRIVRLLIVTPDMHRVHHSTNAQETNSNFGFNLSLWDRLLGTYRSQPIAGHEHMTIGLNAFRSPDEERLDCMLLQPLKGRADDYSITRGNGQT